MTLGILLAMGFHFEEEGVLGGSIDNRVKGKTVLKIDFTDHTASLITLQGNPSRDLAGSLWNFTNPFAKMKSEPGEQCYFTPEHAKVEMKVSPVLELEWFTPKFGQVELDCERITIELVEMVWALTADEAAEGESLAHQTRLEHLVEGEDLDEHIEGIEDYLDHDPEPHEIEEKCFLIVQEFVINSADDSEQKRELHRDLTKLQEQMAGAFSYYDDEEDSFGNVPKTIALLRGLLPFIDRASGSAKFVAEMTSELLIGLRESVIALRNELAEG